MTTSFPPIPQVHGHRALLCTHADSSTAPETVWQNCTAAAYGLRGHREGGGPTLRAWTPVEQGRLPARVPTSKSPCVPGCNCLTFHREYGLTLGPPSPRVFGIVPIEAFLNLSPDIYFHSSSRDHGALTHGGGKAPGRARVGERNMHLRSVFRITPIQQGRPSVQSLSRNSKQTTHSPCRTLPAPRVAAENLDVRNAFLTSVSPHPPTRNDKQTTGGPSSRVVL